MSAVPRMDSPADGAVEGAILVMSYGLLSLDGDVQVYNDMYISSPSWNNGGVDSRGVLR